MPDIRKELAVLICHGNAVLNPKRWLAQESSDLATRIPHLDEIPPQAILPLAMLVADGESDARKLALGLDIDEAKLAEFLDALCEFKFVEEVWNGYKATPAGEQAFEAVGERMIARELLEVKARLQQLEQLSLGYFIRFNCE